MQGKQCVRTPQQRLVRRHADNSDAQAFFNLLTGAELLDKVESVLPTHRERLFPPTETLSMFLVAGTECGALLPEGRKRRGSWAVAGCACSAWSWMLAEALGGTQVHCNSRHS